MKLLSCQVSTHLIDEGKVLPAYFDMLYEALAPEGYARPEHFWEVPNWAAIIAKHFPTSDFYIITNRQEAIEHLNNSDYTHICFSVLDVNKEIVRDIVEGYTGTGTFILSGYIDFAYFKGYKNIRIFDTIQQFVVSEGVSFSDGYDFRHFKGMRTIPRLTMSTGCSYNCTFCVVGQTPINEADIPSIQAQIASFKDLLFQLVYLNDKTFGQAENHKELPTLYEQIKNINPEFKGFIIQTNTVHFLKLSDEFIKDAHIKFVELGIETVNDKILRKHRKPSNVKLTLQATERFRHLPCKLIPNIIIGFAEETYETYANTLRYLRDNQDVISHLNICNLAIYSDTDLATTYDNIVAADQDEHAVDKSFHQDPGPHRWFSDELFKFGVELLRNHSPG